MSKKVDCEFCDIKFGSTKIISHYVDCMPKYYADRSGYLMHIYTPGISEEFYHLYIVVGSNTKFKDIDTFLRDKWFDDPDHLSKFVEINEVIIANTKGNILSKKIIEKKIKKTDNIKNYEEGSIFKYDYDMGDTTEVCISLMHKFTNSDKTKKIELLYQITPDFYCVECTKDATLFTGEEIICEKCSKTKNARHL